MGPPVNRLNNGFSMNTALTSPSDPLLIGISASTEEGAPSLILLVELS